jgi:phytoene dehydrogenase-like protein
MRVDAVVIGSGPNGLVAANLLADSGRDVLVLEAVDVPGGAVRSAELAAPGFVSDVFSSFYPLGIGSPVLADLHLEDHGLRWRHAPHVLAHPLLDGRTAVLSRDLAKTSASVAAFDERDGAAWEQLFAQWRQLHPHLVHSLMTPFPPVRPALGLARRLGAADLLRFARFATLSVRRFAEERFHGEGAGLLLAGNAMHTDLAPEAAGSAVFGWLLAMLGQDVGFPVPEGGAGRLAEALVRRLRAAGGDLQCGAPVTRVLVSAGRATGVELADGRVVHADVVLADVSAPALYRDLLDDVPARLLEDLDRFDWDDGTVKVDWALSGPVPWSNADCAGAGTVHLGGSLDEISRFAHQLAVRQVPDDPFLLFGQMTTADPTRSPEGTESAWAYTHVPQEPRDGTRWSDPEHRDAFLDRVERRVEQFAPGFHELVLGRHLMFPGDLQDADQNLVHGAHNGGTSGLHQQLIFRPTPLLGRPETFVQGLYLASASAHPGGGVHGACGANAAKAALRARTTGRVALAVTRSLVGAAPASRGGAASRRSAP